MNEDGTYQVLWQTYLWRGPGMVATPSLVDVDDDGTPEVVRVSGIRPGGHHPSWHVSCRERKPPLVVGDRADG